MPISDRTKAAFEAASDTIKQLLALSIGSIGGIVALFDEKDASGIQFGQSVVWVDASLMFLATSVICGLMAMGAIAGQLGNEDISAPSTYAPALRTLTGLQLILFGMGIAVIVVAATR